MFHNYADKISFLFFETTDRPTVRAIAAARRIDIALVAEAQNVRDVAARRG